MMVSYFIFYYAHKYTTRGRCEQPRKERGGAGEEEGEGKAVYIVVG